MKQLITSAFIRIRKTNILANFINLSIIQVSNAASLIFIYILIRQIIGLEAFGTVMVASTFCGVASSIVNYGTNQSGIKDIATNIKSSGLAAAFTSVFFLRILIFALYLLVLAGISFLSIRSYPIILFSLPLVFSEVVNPIFFFIGAEKLKLYNIANLISKLLSIVAIFLLIQGPQDAHWVNFIIGLSGALIYTGMTIYLYVTYRFRIILPTAGHMKFLLKDNFYLTINNLSVQLQQSLMVFALGKWASPVVLGAYSFCDKLMWGSRILIIAIVNAIYPRGVQLYKQSAKLWEVFRSRAKLLIALFFLIVSVVLFLVPGEIIYLLTGTNDQFEIDFLRAMALVPAATALNSINVLDLLIKNKNLAIFRISLIGLVLALAGAYFIARNGNLMAIGYYTLGLELATLMFYEAAIRKYKNG